MKKQLLFTTSIFVSGLLCAQVANTAIRIPSNLANIAVLKSAKADDKIINPVMPSSQTKSPVVVKNNARVAAYSESVIGTTLYDLQSNSSPGDRIVVNADGSIAACWTMAQTIASGYSDRGTGYNYYNGAVWSPTPSVRVENTRVGWGNVVNTRSGREVIFSHGVGNANSNLASRATKGSGTWANSTTSPANVSAGNWWPRMVSSSPSGGDTIYAISISYPVASGGALYNGVDGALLFSRSTDAGVTWDIQNQQPTGFTSANYTGFGGDAYAITAKGSTVAIVAGDSDTDVGLAKSTDGGVTWTYSVIYKFPLTLWDYTTTSSDVNNDGLADTISTTDGNFAIALDNMGKAYVSYGAYRLLNDAPSASGYSYFPYTDGLYLWNESMPQNAGGNLIAAIEDRFGDNNIYFPTPSTTGNLAFGRWGCSLTSYPSMAFDGNNDLYVSYSGIVDSLISATDGEKVLRHQFVIKSCNLTPGSEVFSSPMDIVPMAPGAETEGVFGSMAKNINGSVHILYQRDFGPGNGIPPTSGTNPDQLDNYGNPNEIVYVKIPVADFLCVTGIKEAVSSSVSSLNFYPNPASTSATLDIQLSETAKVEVAILNTVGQTVYSTTVSGNAGANKVELNLSNLSSGLYFYQVKVGNSKAITKKFAVGK